VSIVLSLGVEYLGPLGYKPSVLPLY